MRIWPSIEAPTTITTQLLREIEKLQTTNYFYEQLQQHYKQQQLLYIGEMWGTVVHKNIITYLGPGL
jgi:phosphosulfolactate phosphohydrolase-like enzyme